VTALLEVRDVGIEFGGVRAMQAVSFDVNADEICRIVSAIRKRYKLHNSHISILRWAGSAPLAK
jgi:hypothetical protein